MNKRERRDRYGITRKTTQQLIDESIVYLGIACYGGDPTHMSAPFIRQVPGEPEAAAVGIYEMPDEREEPLHTECPIYVRNGGTCGANGEFACDPKLNYVYYGPGVRG